jgi:hypothetical protein
MSRSVIIIWVGIVLVLVGIVVLKTGQPDSGGREVLCIGIMANVNNAARDVPRVAEVCEAVGVLRSDYPATALP